MSAVQSLRTAVDALSRNPVLFLGGLVYALVVLPQRALQLAAVPLAPAALQLLTFFVTPFVLAGVVGMAREALDGEASFGAFTATGSGRYLDLLLATLVEFGIQLAFGVAFLVLALVTVVAAGGGSLGPVAIVGAGLGVALVLAYLIVLFLVQFYPVLVVVDDAGPVDAVSGSVDFVRANLVSTLGYSVITVALGGLSALPVSGFAAYRFLTSGPGAGETPGPIGVRRRRGTRPLDARSGRAVARLRGDDGAVFRLPAHLRHGVLPAARAVGRGTGPRRRVE